jgi:hypothetical protein
VQTKKATVHEITILSVSAIRDLRLIDYLKRRKIDLEIASAYCNKVIYSLHSSEPHQLKELISKRGPVLEKILAYIASIKKQNYFN